VSLLLYIFVHRPLRDMKRRRAAKNALLVKSSTTFKCTALVEKQINSDIQVFISTTRRIPLLMIEGPAKSTPVTANERDTCTRLDGSWPICGCVK